MIIDPKTFPENQNYVMYELYKSMQKDLLDKENLTAQETQKLASINANITVIEHYAIEKRAEGIRWSLTSIFQSTGMNPTLILEFYPGTKSYNNFGKNLVVNVEFSEADLVHIFKSIKNQSPRVTGQLKFKIVPEFTDAELNTGDIFGIQSSR